MTSAPSGTQATHATLIHYIEVWNVEQDGQSMKLASCCRLRGSLVDSESPERSVRNGEGLAGMAWNQRRAVILQEAPSELLDRIGAKNGMELAALFAYPVMKGQSVLSVIVFGVSNGPGAFEVWSRDDRDELSISASYYSGLKSFEFISRHVKFPKGAGLPGAVWKTGQPRLASDLPRSAGFMRSFAADETELNIGLGLPVGSAAGHSDSILLLLSSNSKPIAQGFEIWQPRSSAVSTPEETVLSRIAADWSAASSQSLAADDGITAAANAVVSEAWNTGRPVLSTTASDGVPLRAVLGVPIYRGIEKAAVVVLGF